MTQTHPPRIGLSLRPAYLAGDAGVVERELFGEPTAFLSQLAERGVDSIELRVIGPRTEPAQALAAMQCVHQADLALTIHGALPPMDAGTGWQATLPALIQVIKQLVTQPPTRPCPITVHAYAAQRESVDLLASKTVDRLKQMTAWLDAQRLPVLLALELNRAKAAVDPSTTCQRVLEMYKQVDHPKLTICWDLGHHYANVLNKLAEATAPDGFAAAVGHTHIHDIGSTGRTHWPLAEGRLPLADYVQQLTTAGYDGVWNLELSPDRFADEGAARERVLSSVQQLREAIPATSA